MIDYVQCMVLIAILLELREDRANSDRIIRICLVVLGLYLVSRLAAELLG